MAWQRDEANLGISGATAYSYTEVDWSVNATHAVYRHIGGVTSPYNFGATATSTLQWWESGTWHDYAGPASHYFSGYGDQPILDVEDSFVRQAADRTVSLGCYTTMMGGGARAWIDYTVPHLAPSVTWASSNPVVRNSDNSITLTWNAPALEYSAMCIEVQTDNSGTWSQEIVLWNTATSTTWTGGSAGHSYQFRIRTNYLSSYSAYDTCATIIYNTPLPPEGIATKATSGTNVTVTLNNPSTVATSCDYRLGDGTNWGTVVTGQSTSSFTVDMGAYHYIQVRNTNTTGSSAWLTSEYVNTVTKPNTPNITSPVAGYVDMATGTIRWEWTYSSPDNSEQTQFTFVWWKNSTLQTPVVQSTANHYYVQDISALSAGDEIVARITVKGASSTASTASAAKTVMLYTKPTVTISSPSASVTSMPLSIAATYSDMAGFTCQAATVTLKSGDRTILTKPATINGTAITASIGIDEAILDNGASYTVVLDVRSSSGLQASANASFTTAFTEPAAGTLSISNDPDTGYASLMATFDNHATDVEYSGATNAQFDTTEGYVRSLTVEGQSQAAISRNLLYDSENMTDRWNYGADASVSGGVASLVCPNPATWNSLVNSSLVDFASISGKHLFVSFDYKIPSALNAYVELTGSSLSSTSNNNGSRTKYISGTQSFEAATDWKRKVVDYGTITEASFTSGSGSLVSVYVKITNRNAGVTMQVRHMQVEIGDVATSYEPYFDPYLVSIEGVTADTLNLVRVADLQLGYQTAAAAGSTNDINVVQAGTLNNEHYSAYIPCKEGDEFKYWWTGTVLGDYAWWAYRFYDADKKTLGTRGATSWETFELTAPAGAAYIRVSARMYQDGRLMLYRKPYTAPTTITTTLRSLPQGKGDELAVEGTTVKKYDRTYQDTISAVGTVNTSGSTWYAGLTTTNQSTLRRDWSSATDYNNDKGTSSTEYAYCTKTTKVDATGTGLFVARTWNGLYAYCTAADAQVQGITTDDFASLVGAEVIARNKTAVDTLPDISLIELGTAATVLTDLDSTFTMTGWDGSADAVSISVARVNADGITPLIEDAASGAGAVDKYAPLNTPYQYAVTTKSSANAVKTVYVDNEIVTDLWFAYWGENVASAKWNPDNGGIQLTRPQKTRVYYAGRKDPVSYDGSAVALSETPSWMLVDRSEAQPFVQLIEDGGRGVYKSCDGWVYHADFDLTLTPKYTAIGYYGGIMLSVTRIAGEQL